MRYPLLVAVMVALPAFAQSVPIQDRSGSHTPSGQNAAQATTGTPGTATLRNGKNNKTRRYSYAQNNIPAGRENGANVNGEPPSPANADSPNR